ncbi:hypothetical protein [Streptomyces reniochalinae]|uniref:Uncharacterized protein n=1 Tax=Streptomyces reniochalinae TaxID=2250578 RepID=A0A367E7J9_9ACTN|nr:hypothetical protein [Streptomyces reniochalinae]RCG13722.1 hypothetical protein DQ392_30945 [Streptomyces reniochalinae]
MSIGEQYAMDTWRLRSQGQAPPPAPGTHEAKLLRAWWVARKEARRELGQTRAAGRAAEQGRERRSAASGAAPRPLRRRARRA